MIKFTLRNRSTPGLDPQTIIARNLEEACTKLNWQRSNISLVDKQFATEEEIANQNAGPAGSNQ